MVGYKRFSYFSSEDSSCSTIQFVYHWPNIGGSYGRNFGRQYYKDLAGYDSSCVVGTDDPLSLQFTEDYAVKVYVD